jgi:cellulose synthase/poly-beta-1,6-N-acetylglucosamine synthase-like glycosyltransferase
MPGYVLPTLERCSVLIFGYEERVSLSQLLPRVLAEPVGRVLVAYGGNDGTREMLEAIHDPRLTTEYESDRAGKAEAFNRVRSRLEGEVAFLLSGDIRIPPGVFSRVLEEFQPGVGVVIPRIVPRNRRNLLTRLGRVLWDLHDVQLSYLDRAGRNVHGGEFLAIRTDALAAIPPVINDDAYLCLRAHQMGYAVRYARSVVVENSVPETLGELLSQRRRVNYGHTQLLSLGMDPRVLDSLVTRAPGEFVRILGRFLREYPADAFYAPLLALLEGAAVGRGGADFRASVDYSKWPLVRSGKAEPIARS